jgi:RNA polymerase Rpb1, domain 2
MAKFVRGYRIRTSCEADYNKSSIIELNQLIKEWKLHINDQRKSDRRHAFFSGNNQCTKCLGMKFIQKARAMFCSNCNQSVDFNKTIQRAEALHDKRLDFLFTTNVLDNIDPINVDTFPVSFLDSYMRRLSLKSETRMLSFHIAVPNPVFWQSTFIFKLDLILKLVTLLRGNPEEINLNLKKYLTGNKFKLPKRKKLFGCSVELEFISKNDKQQIEYIFSKLFTGLTKESLYYGSLTKRKQGKFSNERKYVMSKRVTNTCRAVITPLPFLKPNEIAIPRDVYYRQFYPHRIEWCLLNRMPSLQPENVTAHRIAYVTNNDCFGISLEIVKNMNLDFDGDQLNLIACKNLESLVEIFLLLNSEKNMQSFSSSSGIKLAAPCDAMHAFKLVVRMPTSEPMPQMLENIIECKIDETIKLMDILSLKFTLENSLSCFNMFCQLSEFYRHVSTQIVSSFDFDELKRLSQDSSISFEEFEQNLQTLNPNILNSVNESFTRYHLYQITCHMGAQHFPPFVLPQDIISNDPIEGNMIKGLSPFDLLKFAQATFCNMVKSIKSVPKSGYMQQKYVHGILDSITDNEFKVREVAT